MSASAFTRRGFLKGASALTAASLLGARIADAVQTPPEVTRVRIMHLPAICTVPQYLAEEMLRREGFSEIDYVGLNPTVPSAAILQGQADFTLDTAPGLIPLLDHGRSVAVLGGIHPGCYGLCASDRIQSLRDLKGKSIGVRSQGAHDHVFISAMLSYVGVDPGNDVNWVFTGNFEGPMQLFIEGKTDAFLGFAPQPRDLQMQNVGHVIVDTTRDRPWSHYFCCMLVGNREFVEKYPVATKKILRAYLKSADICASEPERVARYLAERGFEPRYKVALDVLRSLPFKRWREANPEDTIRFYALRLYDVGMVTNSPNKLISQGTDWRFLDELKRELKA